MKLKLDIPGVEVVGTEVQGNTLTLNLRLDADIPKDPPPHPTSFPAPIIEVLRQHVPKGRVLDPFGGVGTLGTLGPGWEVTSLELEHEWAIQGLDNGCAKVIVGDATKLPFDDRSFPCVATSPAYGNRCADSYLPPRTSRESDRTRRSYTIYLGRPLSDHNGGGLHFGQGYTELHATAIQEMWRVLEPGGSLFLNVKDFIRKGSVVGVVAFWDTYCQTAGFIRTGGASVPLRGDQNTHRHRKQGRSTVDSEQIMFYRKPTESECRGGKHPVSGRPLLLPL